jgi:hypothetical protein
MSEVIKKKGHFLTNGKVAWPIQNRDIALLYHDHAYKPEKGWKYRRIIYTTDQLPSGYYLMAPVQKPPKAKANDQD